MHIRSLIALYIISWSMLLTAPAMAEVELTFDIGMQADYLRWNISDTDNDPNTLSELTFRSLSPIGHLTLRGRSEETPLWYILQYGRGEITDSKIKDQDFASSDRRGLFSYSEHETSGHDVQSAYFRLGYGQLGKRRFSIHPTIGVQWQSARWAIREGRRLSCDEGVINCGSPPNYAAAGLNSMYRAEWLAFSIGGLLQYQLPERPISFTVDANLFPYAGYRGKGVWNLRRDFQQDPSFRHTGDGLGASVMTQAQWRLDENWQLGIGWRGQFFYLKDGKDDVFFSDGTRGTIKLREVIHSTHFLFLNLIYRWGY